MSALLVKINLILFAITAGLGFLIYLISKSIWHNYNFQNNHKQEYLEPILSLALKAFTIVFMFSLFSITISIPILTFMLWPEIYNLTGETPYIISMLMGFLALGGIMAFGTAIQRKRFDDGVYIKADLLTEPELTNLVLSIARYFEVDDVRKIRITPGAKIELIERVETFDDVFSGGDKCVEIGLSAMELLTASDLKVLLARQFTHYMESDDAPIAFIKRLKTRFAAMNDNISGGSFFLALNPVAWLVMAASHIVDLITSDYLTMAEYKADRIVIEYSGVNRLSLALARYGVETELYKELIDIVDDHKRGGVLFPGNIYDSMRRDRGKSTDDFRVIINHLFSDAALSRGDTGKKTLKLRLKRLPESTSIPDLETDRPAVAYLKDRLNTESRMIKLLKL